MFMQGQAYKPNDINGKRRPKKEMNENVVVFYRKQMKMFKKRTDVHSYRYNTNDVINA